MYRPRLPLLGLDATLQPLADWLATELQSIAQAASDKVDAVRFNVLHAAPAKPRAGDVVFADGSDWNPDTGVGLYEYSGTDWKKVGPALSGVTTLVTGTKTVALASVTANTRIFLTSQVDGGTPGWLRVSARSVGVSFTITSSSATDTSTVAYMVIEP
jgi:hypothetical protein